jgi:hypothetical protein
MKSYDFYAYTTTDGTVICTDCTGQLKERYEIEKGLIPIFADSEWDYFPECDLCHQKLTYMRLTKDGIEHESQQHT